MKMQWWAAVLFVAAAGCGSEPAKKREATKAAAKSQPSPAEEKKRAAAEEKKKAELAEKKAEAQELERKKEAEAWASVKNEYATRFGRAAYFAADFGHPLYVKADAPDDEPQPWEEKLFMVRIKFEGVSDSEPIPVYHAAAAPADDPQVRLEDEQGRVYARVRPELPKMWSWLNGKGLKALRKDQWDLDLIVFEPPPPDAREFRLTLPGKAIRHDGPLRFKFSAPKPTPGPPQREAALAKMREEMAAAAQAASASPPEPAAKVLPIDPWDDPRDFYNGDSLRLQLVKVTIAKPRVAPKTGLMLSGVQGTKLKDDLMIARFRVSARSDTGSMDVPRLGDDSSGRITLTDDQGNEYRIVEPPSGQRWAENEAIALRGAGDEATVVVAFELPKPGAKEMRMTIDGIAIRKSGLLRFKFPAPTN